jgi:hypothetical protein
LIDALRKATYLWARMDLKGAVAGRRLLCQAPSRWGLARCATRCRLTASLSVAAAVVAVQLVLISPVAMAHGHQAPNPPSNFKVGPLPSMCASAPTGAKCINAAVFYLDQARAKLHLAPYRLPANFVKLAPDHQILILSNLDRGAYHLPAIAGVTRALNRVARGGTPADPGVRGDGDPILHAVGVQTTSNWALGFPNIVLAYEAWMYDDGPGSGNLDCTASNHAGCWGHRQDVLADLLTPGSSAMGVAAGRDAAGRPGYAMLIAKGHSSYTTGYSYRWTQAVADGAGRHNYAVARPDTRTVQIGAASLQGHTLIVHIQAPGGIPTRCSLSRRNGAHWSRASYHSCGKVAEFHNIRPGEYRLRVRSSLGVVIRDYTVS